MALDPDSYARLERAFHRARELPAAARDAFLAAELGADGELVEEARRLLRHAGDEDGFLDQPAALPPAAAAPRPEPRATIRIEGYRIEEEIGRGASGVVYLAREQRHGRQVALKVLRADFATDQDLARFRREARLLARVDHPGLPRLLGSGVEQTPLGPRPWLALSAVHGRPLAEAARGLDARALARLFAGVADAVHAAHAQSVVHRDLKPANVVVDARGNPVVLDFGVAALRGADQVESLRTAPGSLLGTLAYMAPEQTLEPDVDARADVYALGAMLYELATGALPVEVADVDLGEALRRIREEPPARRVRGVPRDLSTVLHCALDKDPARRYPTAAALAADLRAFADDRPIGAEPPTPLRRLAQLARRHRGLVAALAAVFAALALGLVGTAVALGRARAAEARARADEAETERRGDALLALLLREQIASLWPATPERLPELEDWVLRGEQLLARLPAHRRWAAAGPGGRDARLRERFEEAARLFDPPPGEPGFADLVSRRDFARALHARTVGDHRAAWDAAIAEIAASPRYGGLRIVPQLGLVPLGADPASGLFEFAHCGPSGELARRDPAGGAVSPEPGAGIVLVLLPGGEVELGHQAADRDAPLHSPHARLHEAVHRLQLDPFFISKFETTQGQYERAVGTNPSWWAPGDLVRGYAFTELHPVENVNWNRAMECAARLDLALPTEDQFEYAHRGGTRTPWWSGASFETLRGKEWAAQVLAPPHGAHDPSWQDLAREHLHVEVGRFAPNPFGLHDLAGNLGEWCRDVFWVDIAAAPPRAGDGLRSHVEPGRDALNPHRSVRGGRTHAGPETYDPGWRDDAVHENAQTTLGFRLARALDRVERGAP